MKSPQTSPIPNLLPADFSGNLASSRSIPLWKRSLDLFLTITALVILSPVMLIIGLWIKMVSEGSMIYCQERIGLNGATFRIFKFRTLALSADCSDHETHVGNLISRGLPMAKLDDLRNEQRIPGSCFLRASGLDELPQLWNILRGEMSLVGPRPCLSWEYHRFYQSRKAERFEVLPGLTGLWQVSGKNSLTFEEMIDLDVQYARGHSVIGDLKIILNTPQVLLKQLKPLFLRTLGFKVAVKTCDPKTKHPK